MDKRTITANKKRAAALLADPAWRGDHGFKNVKQRAAWYTMRRAHRALLRHVAKTGRVEVGDKKAMALRYAADTARCPRFFSSGARNYSYGTEDGARLTMLTVTLGYDVTDYTR